LVSSSANRTNSQPYTAIHCYWLVNDWCCHHHLGIGACWCRVPWWRRRSVPSAHPGACRGQAGAAAAAGVRVEEPPAPHPAHAQAYSWGARGGGGGAAGLVSQSCSNTTPRINSLTGGTGGAYSMVPQSSSHISFTTACCSCLRHAT
jgi:hypothetical protein